MSGNEPPISKEAYEALKTRVKMVADKMGVKPPRVFVVDINDANADYHASQGPSMDPPLSVIHLNVPLLTLLTPRELNTIIAHETGHKENLKDKQSRKLKGTVSEEMLADERAVKEWGDPEAFISALQKMDHYNPVLTELETVKMAGYYSHKNITHKYEHASGEKREEILKNAQDFLKRYAGLSEKYDPHPEVQDRIDHIRSLQANMTPAMQERKNWSDKLDAVETSAHGLVSGTAEALRDNLKQLFQATGINAGTAPGLSVEEARSLGEKLLKEVPPVRDEQMGHTMGTITDIVKKAVDAKAQGLHPKMNESITAFQAASGKNPQSFPVQEVAVLSGNYSPLNKSGATILKS